MSVSALRRVDESLNVRTFWRLIHYAGSCICLFVISNYRWNLAQTKLLLLFSLTDMPAERDPTSQTVRREHIQITGLETNHKSKTVHLKCQVFICYILTKNVKLKTKLKIWHSLSGCTTVAMYCGHWRFQEVKLGWFVSLVQRWSCLAHFAMVVILIKLLVKAHHVLDSLI